MQCDRVFMVLTQGPFPTGDPDDQALEDHLLSCESCRRFAIALQPTLDLFDEASWSEGKETLPAYWGRLISADEHPSLEETTSSVQTNVANARIGGMRFGRSLASRGKKTKRNDPRSRWPLAGAFVVGIVFCLTSLEWLAGSSLWSERTTAGTATRSGDPTQNGRTELAGITPLANPTVCPKHDVQADDNASVGETSAEARTSQEIATAGQAKECCTKCHHADAPATLTSTQMAQVVQTCSECH